MTHDNGGPAFPREVYVNPNGVTIRTGSDGMALRDWFAGQALAGIVAADAIYNEAMDRNTDPIVLAAKSAYSLADAMLAERARNA